MFETLAQYVRGFFYGAMVQRGSIPQPPTKLNYYD